MPRIKQIKPDSNTPAPKEAMTSPQEVEASNSVTPSNKTARIKRKKKQESFLTAMVDSGKNGLNTFEARDLYGDTFLHTSISSLKINHKIEAEWKRETLNNEHMTSCHRYWLSDDDIPKAMRLVNRWRVMRGENPRYEVIS